MKAFSRLFRFPWLPVWLSVPILLAALILLSPVYLRGKALFWGTPLLQFIPWWTQAWSSLLSGHLPLWNPWVGMGAPLLANYQSGLLYPIYWVYLLLYTVGGVPAMAWGQAIVVALHLAWAGAGMALLARRLGLGGLAQGVSGLAFGLSGYLVSRAGFLSINAAAAWLPWVIACLTPLSGESGMRPRRWLALTACLAMQLLAGHAQTAWYTLLLAGMWCAVWVWDAPLQIGGNDPGAPASTGWSGRISRILRQWGWLALAVLLASGLAAAQLLPTGEYLLQSQRSAAVDYAFAMNYSFWPWHLITLLAPSMFGSPVTGDYWGYANFWEDAIYVGLLPLLLAISALVGSMRRMTDMRRKAAAQPSQVTTAETAAGKLDDSSTRRLTWFLAVLFGLALLLALGSNTPVFPWLYRHAPTFAMFQAPARYMLWAEFSLALLAGLGAERWRRPTGWGLYWTRLGTAGAFAVMLGACSAWLGMGDVSPTFIRATAIAGLWGVGAGLLSLAAPPSGQAPTKAASRFSGLPRKSIWFAPPGAAAESAEGRAAKPAPVMSAGAMRRWKWGVLLLVAADLLVAGWGLNPGTDLNVYGPSFTAVQVRQMANGSRTYISNADEKEVKYTRFLRFDTYNPGEDWRNLRAAMLANENILDGVASSNNFDPLLPGNYSNWMEALDKAGFKAREDMLSLMDVGVIETADSSAPYGVAFRPQPGASRLRWMPCVYYAGSEAEILKLITSGSVDLVTEAILMKGQATGQAVDECAASQNPAAAPATELSLHQDGPNRLIAQVHAEARGILLLSEVWYPGWKVTVDGKAAPLLKADTLFQAVQVEAGEHQVVFNYRPLSFAFGAGISLAACLVYAFLWYKHRVK